jgi:hypothetical protein
MCNRQERLCISLRIVPFGLVCIRPAAPDAWPGPATESLVVKVLRAVVRDSKFVARDPSPHSGGTLKFRSRRSLGPG